MADIVVVGSYNRDVVLSVDRLPTPGETCLARGRMEAHGGKGSNQAAQAARCGASVAMLGAVGQDAAGEAALIFWAEERIDSGAVARLADIGTGMALIQVDAAGENVIVVDSGANAALSPEHVGAAAGVLRSAKLVLAQLETPLAATEAAFAVAREAGGRTLLNAAPALPSLDRGLLALTDVLVVNEGEGRALAGEDALPRIGEALLSQVAQAVVVTRGAGGALLFRPGREALVRPAHGVEVVDTTGAGDAFIGAFAAELVRSGRLESALSWGLAAGALACGALGATASFGGETEVRAMAAGLASPPAQKRALGP